MGGGETMHAMHEFPCLINDLYIYAIGLLCLYIEKHLKVVSAHKDWVLCLLHVGEVEAVKACANTSTQLKAKNVD